MEYGFWELVLKLLNFVGSKSEIIEDTFWVNILVYEQKEMF